MSAGLKEQWGVDAPAKVGPDAQSQELKAAFEKLMDAIGASLQYTAANGERARHDPLETRRGELVPRYQAALDKVDPADAAKAKDDIDKLLADAQALSDEAAAFRSETEKAIAEWQSRQPSYDKAVVQVEELQAWPHPKEGAVRGLADGIRTQVNDRAYPKAVTVLEQFLPKLQPVYEDYQRQKAAQQQYEPALAALQPRLQAAPTPSPFAKLAPMQSDLVSAQSAMEASAQERDFVAALEKVSGLGTQVDAYKAEVEKLQQQKQQYEQALAQVQPKLQAAPSPFKKLEATQTELASGQQQMETAAQAEEFEQALTSANDLGTKADAYKAEVEKLQQQKQQYEQALAQVQPKLQAAPSPAPFKKLEATQAELASGQQQMESSAQAEEFEQALTSANDLGTKADAYKAEVEKLQQQKQQYEQALAQVQPKLQAAPSPAPFKKLEATQAELSSGQQQMESSAQAEEFEQALTSANDLGTKADAYKAEVEKLQQQKQQYEQALAQVQPKLQAAPSPAPFKKLEATQAELASGQQQMESSAQAEDFEQALTSANDLGTKADAYKAEVEKLQQQKQQYEQALAQVQPKLQAAPSPAPFKKLEATQAELASGQQQMESSAQAEEFEQALTSANDLGTKADAYKAEVEKLQQQKQQYEQALAQVQPKLQAAPSPAPFKKLEATQAELASGQQQMETAAQSEDFEQALTSANDLGTKADAYKAEVEKLQQQKQQYEQALAQVQPKLQAAPSPAPFKKLEATQAELASGQQQMETAAQSEDFEQALTSANDLGTKADAYKAEVEKLQQQKQQYEQALAQVQPKLQEAGQKTAYQKLAQQKTEYESLKGEMESAAQAEDYESALAKCTDLTGRVDAYIQAVNDLEAKKQQYEQALETVKQKLESIAQSNHPKLAPKKQEIENLKSQMESAAQTEDYETALAKANEVIAKVDEYATAAKELEEKEKQYNQGHEALKPKLDEAAKSQHPETANLQTLRSQMETSAQNGEFDQALQSQQELKAKVENILAAPQQGGGAGPDGQPVEGASPADPSGAVPVGAPAGPPVVLTKTGGLTPQDRELAEKFLKENDFRADRITEHAFTPSLGGLPTTIGQVVIELEGKIAPAFSRPNDTETHKQLTELVESRFNEAIKEARKQPPRVPAPDTPSAPAQAPPASPPASDKSPVEAKAGVEPEVKGPKEKPDPNKPPKEKLPPIQAILEFTIYKNEENLGAGTTKVEIALGPRGNVEDVSVDVAAIKDKVKLVKFSDKASIKLEAKLAVNTKMEFEDEVIKAVKMKLKGEVEVTFPGVPLLEHVTLKFGAKFGQGGYVFAPGIEIPLPGSAPPPKPERSPRVPISVTIENTERRRAMLLHVVDKGAPSGNRNVVPTRRIQAKQTLDIEIDADPTYLPLKGWIMWRAQRADDSSAPMSKFIEVWPVAGTTVSVSLDPITWSELAPLCEKFLTDHGFTARRGTAIVPGDNAFDMFLDGGLVELRAMTSSGSAAICAALEKEFPELKDFPVQLQDLVRKRWEVEIKRV